MSEINNIAICFSGAVRYFDKTYPSLKRYVLNNFPNADIFLHMWILEDLDNLEYNFKWVKDMTDTNKLIEELQPKDYVIQNFNSDFEKLIKKESKINFEKLDNDEKLKNYGFNCISMYWKIMKCYELAKDYALKNNIQYDLVIRIRIDFIWEQHISPQNFLPFNQEKVYIIQDRYATFSKKVNNDKFFAGSVKVMEKMSNIFKDIYILHDNGHMLDGQVINEEAIKLYNLDHVWIGNLNTYYKCMGRHLTKYNSNNVYIECDNNTILNELSYRLFNYGYNVNSKNELENYNKAFHYYQKVDNHKYTIIFDENNISINHKKITVNKDLYNFICKQKLYTIIDFIISLLRNYKSSKDIYIFNDVKQINYIDKNDTVVYKYLDRGYYNVKYVKTENNENYVMFSNKEVKVKRDTFKVYNLLKYYNIKENKLPINY